MKRAACIEDTIEQDKKSQKSQVEKINDKIDGIYEVLMRIEAKISGKISSR